MTSTPGLGSTFSFDAWLDVVSELSTEAADSHGDTFPIEGLRALVIGDDMDALQPLQQTLRVLGMVPNLVTNDHAAVLVMQSSLGRRQPYDIVIAAHSRVPPMAIPAIERLRQVAGEGTPLCVIFAATTEGDIAAAATAARIERRLVQATDTAAVQGLLVDLLRPAQLSGSSQTDPESAVEAQLRAAHHGKRVLLVEDNAVNREVAEGLMAAAGLTVESAVDGRAAVQMALSNAYDAILMDIQMPNMDGLQAARAIRDAGGVAVPIIALTANAFREDRELCLAAGMNDHLAKPFSAIQIYSTLLKWLS